MTTARGLKPARRARKSGQSVSSRTMAVQSPAPARGAGLGGIEACVVGRGERVALSGSDVNVF